MAAKGEGGEGVTLHEAKKLSEEEIAERTKEKLKADQEKGDKVRDELDAANKKVAEQAKREAEEDKAELEKREKAAAKEAHQAAASVDAGHPVGGPARQGPGVQRK